MLGVIDDWRLVMRGGDDANIQRDEIYMVVWARIPVRDFPDGKPLGLVTLEKGRLIVIEVHEQYSILQSIADPDATPWLVQRHPDMPPIAVGDEMEQISTL